MGGLNDCARRHLEVRLSLGLAGHWCAEHAAGSRMTRLNSTRTPSEFRRCEGSHEFISRSILGYRSEETEPAAQGSTSARRSSPPSLVHGSHTSWSSPLGIAPNLELLEFCDSGILELQSRNYDRGTTGMTGCKSDGSVSRALQRMNTCLRKSASIQPRTILAKFL